MKIKVKLFDENCAITVNEQGDWFDLKTRCNVFMDKPQAGVQYQKDGYKYRDVNVSYSIVPLGVAMKLPEGFEAILAPRSSTFKKYQVIQTNSFGVIDNSYSGNSDEWGLPILALGEAEIPQYTRICQFRIQLSQKATIWQKIKWLFDNKIEIEYVDNLEDEDRGGFGSTGEQ